MPGGVAVRRLCVLAVLASLSVAATTGLLRPPPSSDKPVALGVQSATAAEVEVPELPDSVQAPASVTHHVRPDLGGLGVVTDASFATVDAIPGRALVAYQRAETVIRMADPSCNLSWQLIAAIGKVESNHGRFAGSLMTADGVVHPAIYGPQLTGKGATSRIDDTDAGLLDGDQRFDRAVGPMQFIPSTWTVVGVDADGDGRRDPQDVDDASLATAVYLCSGDDDLATRAGQRNAVLRYNHSKAYVGLVLRIMMGYLHADLSLFRVIGGPGYTTTLPPSSFGPGDPTPEAQPTFEAVPSPTPTGTSTPEPSDSPTPTATASPTGSGPAATTRPTPSGAPTSGAPTSGSTPSDTAPSNSAPSDTPPTATDAPTDSPTTTATETPTQPSESPTTSPPTGEPTDVPSNPGDPAIPQELLDAWTSCLDAGVDAADRATMTACLVEATGLPADDPALLALLADPPVTPPVPTQSVTQPRRRRRSA